MACEFINHPSVDWSVADTDGTGACCWVVICPLDCWFLSSSVEELPSLSDDELPSLSDEELDCDGSSSEVSNQLSTKIYIYSKLNIFSVHEIEATSSCWFIIFLNEKQIEISP